VLDLNWPGSGALSRPDAKELTGPVSDALFKVGVEETIKPPVQPHGR
jgi:hypothetical protein